MLHWVHLYTNIQLEYSLQNERLNLMVLIMKISCYHKALMVSVYMFASTNVSICVLWDFTSPLFCNPVNDQHILILNQVNLNNFFLFNRSSVSWERKDFLKPSVSDGLSLPLGSWEPCTQPACQCPIVGTLHRAAQRWKILSLGSQMWSQ